MLNFKSFLAEGRDATLYHGTSLISAELILSSNSLKGSTTSPAARAYKDNILIGKKNLPKLIDLATVDAWKDAGERYRKLQAGLEKISCISTTRTHQQAAWYKVEYDGNDPAVILHLNERIVAYTNKIEPIQHHAKYARSHGAAHDGFDSQHEEVIIGTLSPVVRYIQQVEFYSENYPTAHFLLDKDGYTATNQMFMVAAVIEQCLKRGLKFTWNLKPIPTNDLLQFRRIHD